MDPVPSITIHIDAETKNVTIALSPQPLSPAQYGVVLASIISHLARLFAESNPGHSEDEMIADIQKGIRAGLDQRDDIVLAQKPH